MLVLHRPIEPTAISRHSIVVDKVKTIDRQSATGGFLTLLIENPSGD
jgi:hypothetical protein